MRPLKQSALRSSTHAAEALLEHQAMFDPSFPHDWWNYMRSCDVAELTDDVIDIAVDRCSPNRLSTNGLPDLADGRGAHAVGEADTAFTAITGLHVQHHRDDRVGRRLRGRAGLVRGSGRPSSPTTPACTSTSSWTRPRSGPEAYGAEYDRLKASNAAGNLATSSTQPEHPAGLAPYGGRPARPQSRPARLQRLHRRAGAEPEVGADITRAFPGSGSRRSGRR